MEKIMDIVGMIATENGVSEEQVIEAIKDSMIKMAKKEIDENANFTAFYDTESKDLRLAQKMLVCEDSEFESSLESTHIPLSSARELASSVQAGDELEYEIDLETMNRSAINHIFQDIGYQIQRLSEQESLRKIESEIGHLVTANVVHIDDNGNTSLEIGDVLAYMPMKYRIKGEKFKIGQSIRCILKSARITKNGLKVELSRTTPKMIEELLMLEVPEIKDGEVTIYKVARIPGEKAKVALFTNNPKIDPIGSAVGTKGVRISAISKELNGESIDCIEYVKQPEIFIAKALSPAQIISVKIERNRLSENERPIAIIQLAQSQKSKAIGKKGINIRLASLITGFDFEIKEIAEKSPTPTSELDSKALENKDIESKEEKKLGVEALESLFKGNDS
ncbi:transcription termination/antitermination protein NusA [Helicobacter saguini]|uniref:Transcription termination/antitermination protein NusA n=1 Tax=Helicobacter saguini TaxID=1548018 RepID=A0A347VTH8_9HELI|nr:transcription termination factor NusA [Helicobacter saguini]MWV62090.1 transcription termination/antitermination protein NusA [Helicobacter saguini]MWV67237.1 transcription termination/antitermination protein NusA [Helicobacter saguini]MWV69590.1 transcription termination/antitermination protein NusA [Helicobacter saguini]MWV70860.1 transcription termination/antitermination protein NusA [Helicobacter saguini]TLD94306.1 transcription termination/antitermination protein NusA [Helicobacter sag